MGRASLAYLHIGVSCFLSVMSTEKGQALTTSAFMASTMPTPFERFVTNGTNVPFAYFWLFTKWFGRLIHRAMYVRL